MRTTLLALTIVEPAKLAAALKASLDQTNTRK